MSDFDREVSIKLRRRMAVTGGGHNGADRPQMQAVESIELYRPPRRKPVAVLIAGTRPQVLRDLAEWIEDYDDDLLTAFEHEVGQ